ncbi:TLD-domain-containing protein [Umbelopsis sp. PMI_123]|nr:TLD-domain-containing protein [Umbelopsis sp. PMI_123]
MGQNESSLKRQEEDKASQEGSQDLYGSSVSMSPSSLSFARSKADMNTIRSRLSKWEVRSLYAAFNDLKTTFSDNFECIELKKFLDLLDLPASVEPAGILLFKSFSYLASFPKCDEAGPIPLTLDGFITAFAIMTGKLENDQKLAAKFEDLFLESIAVLPAPNKSENSDAAPDGNFKDETRTKDDSATRRSARRGLSLADLGVTFDDDDQPKDSVESNADEQDAPDVQILCRDISSILAFLLWMVRVEWEDTQYPVQINNSCEEELKMANNIVNSISNVSYSGHSSDLPCISLSQFRLWRIQNAPNLFKGLQSFMYSKFAMYEQPTIHSTTGRSEIVMSPDITPKPDKTELLTTIYIAMICWNLPDRAMSQKQWNLLYNADTDGYAMNNFVSHVFKYPGPTLLILQVEAIGTATSSLSLSSSYQELSSASSAPKHPGSPLRRFSSSAQLLNTPKSMLLGAYIPEPWKQPKQYWGSSECFVFELGPNYEVYRPIGKGQQYIYCHKDFGIAFGGTSSYNGPPASQTHRNLTSISTPPPNAFLLTLDDSLQKGTYVQDQFPAAPTFGKGHTREKFAYFFETASIEAFGLGGQRARMTQADDWQFDRKEAEKRAGVNIRKDGKGVDRQLLQMAGVIEDDGSQDN